MWKGTLRVSRCAVPVKLYAAAQERGVHFRLLHARDRIPVKQHMIDPETGEEVAAGDVRRGIEVEKDRFVVLRPEELEETEVPEDRTIEVSHFVAREAVDLGWYARPYFLGPDRSGPDFAALAEAIAESDRVGIAHWAMRGRLSHGALTSRDGALALIALHPAEEVVPLRMLERPEGPAVTAAERKLAEQLVASLDGPFEPETLRDEFRERVLAFVASKAKGKKFRIAEEPRPRAVSDLAGALKKSLARAARGKETRVAKERRVA